MTLSPRPLVPLLLAAALGACAATPEKVALEPRTPLDTWAKRIAVDEQPDEIRLAVHDTGLSGTQARALSEFAVRWASAEAGEIVVQSPNGSDTGGAYRTGTGAQAYLVDQGVPAHMVRLVGYDAEPGAPVIVGFVRYAAVTPVCGTEWGNLTSTARNETYANFGCAVASNLAAQVANPADLLGPRAMTPTDAQRRDTVMAKYRAGQPTSAEREPNAAGSISTAVN
jgi:pilus assembly protein CpaD